MSQFNPSIIWTEREGDIPGTVQNEGDWEACVATSVSMALLYGGVPMAAPYTQKQRELIEYYGSAADRDQNLALSDIMTLKVYGVRLRGPSVATSKEAFLARPGMGFCLTGTGSPVGAQLGTFTHEVFAVCINPTTIRVYDPLLPAGSPPRDRTVAQIAAWMTGIAEHQVREVRENEFGGSDPMIESLNGYADGTFVRFEYGKQYQFFSFEGSNGARISWAWTAPSSGNLDVPCEGLVKLKGEGPAYFLPRIYTAPSGQHTNAYLPSQYVPAGPTFPVAPAGDTEPLKQRIEELEQSIKDHVEQVTKPEDDLLATVE